MKTFLVVFVIALAGCRAGPTDASMAALTKDLQDRWSYEIAAISFENAPPLDPPTIFVDINPAVSAADELAWLCTSVKGRVDDVDSRIEVATTYHDLRTDCP